VVIGASPTQTSLLWNLYMYCTSCCKSLLALILQVLASFVNSKTIHQHTQREGTNHCTSSMATARTETTRGPTYSMTRAIGLPHGKKVSSVDGIVCIATKAHSQWTSLVTWTDLSNNGHIDEHVGKTRPYGLTHFLCCNCAYL